MVPTPRQWRVVLEAATRVVEFLCCCVRRLKYAPPHASESHPRAMKTFEDLGAFKCAIELMLAVHAISEGFPGPERYGMTSQIRRASLSVMRHIAEGQGRLSDGEWRQFLSQARGSLYEVQSDTIAALHLGYIRHDQYELLRAEARRVAAPLNGLIRYVLKRERARKTKRRATTQQPDDTTTSP